MTINEANVLVNDKNYGETIIYTKGEYEQQFNKFLIEAHRVNKDDSSFEEIRYEVKRRQTTSSLYTILNSKKVILLIHPNPLPRSLKVTCVPDPKNKNTLTVFIDVSEIISMNDGYYKLIRRDITPLVSYLACGMNSMIYHAKPTTIVNNSTIIKYGTNCFCRLFSYLIDYLRVGGVDNIREVSSYMAGMYFQIGILGLSEDSESVTSKAKNFSKITDRRISEIKYLTADIPELYIHLDKFINGLNNGLRIDNLSMDTVINKWVFLFGTGTLFGLELYEAFANIMINAYVGGYLNNQNTIEKIAASDMVEFVKGIFRIGGEMV